jgi:hypothetical protein
MNYQSLGQYFYKLYALTFLIMLVPLGVFIFLYQGLRLEYLDAVEWEYSVGFTSYVVVGIAGLNWLTAFFLFQYRLLGIRKIQGLGERLSQYASLTLVRMGSFVVGMLFLAVGYYLTQNKWLTIIFLMSLLLPIIRWPNPKRVCQNLALRGDEYKIVFYRMDA